MPFDWKEYYNLSKKLQKITSGTRKKDAGLFEACCRSAVSRVYYAAYHISSKFAEENLGYSTSGTGEDHKLLRNFLNTKDREYKRLSKVLGRICQSRVNCDYYDNLCEKLDDTVTNSIADAEEIFSIIDAQ